MPITIAGSGTITGLSQGGLPANSVTAATCNFSPGKILQMVQSEVTSSTNLDATSNSGQDWADIGQTQTITMAAASSKVVVVVEGSFYQEVTDLDAAITVSYKVGSGSYSRLGHDASPDSKGLCGIYANLDPSGLDLLHHVSINYMHTPSSYSVGDVLTYKLEYKANKDNNDWCGKDGSREPANYIRLIEVAA